MVFEEGLAQVSSQDLSLPELRENNVAGWLNSPVLELFTAAMNYTDASNSVSAWETNPGRY